MYQTEGKNQCFKCIKDRGIVACHDRLQQPAEATTAEKQIHDVGRDDTAALTKN